MLAPGDSSIWLQNAETFDSRPLLKQSQNEYYESPSFSPDGSQVVFVAYTFDRDGGQVKEIRAIGFDGTNSRTLFQVSSDGPRTFLGDPRYSPDGAWIYFSVSTIQDDVDRKTKSEIARGPASGGNWQVISVEGDHPTLSSDGKRLAFLRFNQQLFSSSLWVSNSDGSKPQELLADDVFAAIAGPRFSPDGNWIAFAASGPPKKSLKGAFLRFQPHYENASRLGQPLCAFGAGPVCLVPSALADGLPWDIWLVSSDGKQFEQITNLGLDSPWPAFSRDGRFVAIASTNGLLVFDREEKVVSLLDTERVHGVIDWFQK